MAGAWKEIVDSSFTVNGKALNKDGISIEKEDITGLTGILTGIDGDITSKVDKTAKIGTTAIGTGIATLDTTAIPSLAISKITGLQTNLDAKVPSTFKIGDQVLTGTGITLLEATIPTLGQAKITGLVTDLASKVPTSRKIAGKALTADITLAKGDVGLDNVPNLTEAQLSTAIREDIVPNDIPELAQSKIAGLATTLAGKVPTTRKVAGKALTADITLAKGDVGLSNVENKSSATIRGEIVVANIPSDIPTSKISGLDNSLSVFSTNMNDMDDDIDTIFQTPINGKLLKNGDITLETQDLIPEKTTLPTTGVNGQIVKQGNQLFIWKESAV